MLKNNVIKFLFPFRQPLTVPVVLFLTRLTFIIIFDFDVSFCPIRSMLRLFDAGMEYTEVNDEDEFYFRDFSFYYTKIHSSSFPLMRNPGFYILFWLFNFYFWSAVFFCAIMSDNAVCPRNDDGSRYYGGWVTSVYFASVTMSTVGYGDVSLYEYGQPKWMTFVAILYMLIAMAFAFTVFSSAVELALSDKGMGCANCFTWLKNKIIENEDVPLYKQVRRLILLRVIELSLYFFILNMVGVFITRAFVGKETSSDGQEWNWMTSLYWAIQTSTTIGTYNHILYELFFQIT